MINEAANLDEINRVVIVDKSVQELIALDIPQFNQLAEENDYWNLCIYSEIIKNTKMNYTVTTLDDEFSRTYNFINGEKIRILIFFLIKFRTLYSQTRSTFCKHVLFLSTQADYYLILQS